MIDLTELNAADLKKLLALRQKVEALEQSMAKILKDAARRSPSLSVAVRNMRIPRNAQPSLREMITGILAASDKPMSVADIYDASVATGYQWRSKEPLNALNVKMYTDDAFKKVAPGRFVLRKPAAG